jgi:hypothetical protein
MGYIEIPFADGTVVRFETDDQRADGPVGLAVVEPERQLQDLAEGLHKVAEPLRSRLAPDEITIEAGVTFSAQAGVLFAKTAVEGNITVSLTWQK